MPCRLDLDGEIFIYAVGTRLSVRKPQKIRYAMHLNVDCNSKFFQQVCDMRFSGRGKHANPHWADFQASEVREQPPPFVWPDTQRHRIEQLTCITSISMNHIVNLRNEVAVVEHLTNCAPRPCVLSMPLAHAEITEKFS